MPLTNGSASTASHHLMPGTKTLDPSRALDILQTEHSSGDGLDAETLLDSKTRGGLTYNDFLILPGYIGTLSREFSQFPR